MIVYYFVSDLLRVHREFPFSLLLHVSKKLLFRLTDWLAIQLTKWAMRRDRQNRKVNKKPFHIPLCKMAKNRDKTKNYDQLFSSKEKEGSMTLARLTLVNA